MFIPTHRATSKQRVSPPKRGAAEPVNLKTHRNPAKTAQRPFGLVRSRVHLFARISCVFKECVSHRLGKWFSSFCRNKRTNKKTLIPTDRKPIYCSNILQTPPNEESKDSSLQNVQSNEQCYFKAAREPAQTRCRGAGEFENT